LLTSGGKYEVALRYLGAYCFPTTIFETTSASSARFSCLNVRSRNLSPPRSPTTGRRGAALCGSSKTNSPVHRFHSGRSDLAGAHPVDPAGLDGYVTLDRESEGEAGLGGQAATVGREGDEPPVHAGADIVGRADPRRVAEIGRR